MKPLAVILVLGALSGCSGLLHSTAPAPQLYALPPPEQLSGRAAQAAAARAGQPVGNAGPTLRIARPTPGPGLDTDRIALLRPDNRFDYYAGARWNAPLPELVADLERTVFRADGHWGAVADERSSLNADYLLQTSIERFTADYADAAGPPQVQVELHLLLIRRSDASLLGSFAASASVPARENRMASVMTAFAQAAQTAVITAQNKALLAVGAAQPLPAP